MEEFLLASCLLDGRSGVAACLEAKLSPESFFDPRRTTIFGVLVELYNRQVSISLETVAEELRSSGRATAAGGLEYFIELTGRVPTTAQTDYFIEKVRDFALRREIIAAAARSAEQCFDFDVEIDTLASDIETRFSEVTQARSRAFPPVMKFSDLVGPKERPTPMELVHGVLYRGGKAMLGGGSKSFKTWVLLDLALSIATGTPWWGMKTQKTPVLFVNFELQTWSFERRVKSIMKAKAITEAPDFYSWHLRGYGRDFAEMRLPLQNKIRFLKAGLCVLDPIYKCLGARDENSNGEVGDLLNEIESVAVNADVAMVHGHHFSKGNQSEKEAKDRSSGAGAWARDPDALITLTPHEEEECFAAEFVLRDQPAKKPMVVRWKAPCMEIAPGLDPGALRAAGRPKANVASDIVDLLEGKRWTFSEWRDRAEGAGINASTFKRRLNEAVKSGLVVCEMGTYRAVDKEAKAA